MNKLLKKILIAGIVVVGLLSTGFYFASANGVNGNGVSGLQVVTHDSSLFGTGTFFQPLGVVGGGGSGTVTSVSVLSANGLAGTVATATTTPAITLSTSITGLLKGNGTAISSATAGSDYLASVISDSPLTGAGTSASHLSCQTANTSQAGCISSGDWNSFNNKPSGSVTTSQIAYGNGSNVLTSDANLTWDGSNLTIAGNSFNFNNGSGANWLNCNFGNASCAMGDVGLVNNGTQLQVNDNAEEIVGMTANHFDIRDPFSQNWLHIDTTGSGSESYYDGALFGFNTQNPTQAVDVKGNVNIAGDKYYMVNNQNFATEDVASNIKIGVSTGGSLGGGTNNVLLGDGAGFTIVNGSSTVNIGVDADTGNITGSMAVGFAATGNGFFGNALGLDSTLTANNQFVMGSTSLPITNMYFGNGVTASSPAAWTFHGTGGSGTNISGASIGLVGGQSTGTGVGGDILFYNTPAGTTGTSTNLTVNNLTLSGSTGLVSKYNGLATVGLGIPSEIVTVDAVGQNAAIGTTTLFTPVKTGWYRIPIYLQVTTVASTSSILGGATGVVITYKDGDGGVTQTDTVALATTAGAIAITSAGNTTATNLNGSIVIYAQASQVVQYSIGYTSVGVTAMKYSAHLRVESL